VVVEGHKEPELLIGFLGAAKAGHPYVPVEDNLPPQRLSRIVETAGAALTLTPGTIAELAPAAVPAATEPRPAPGRRPPDTPYYIMFTSGSTGEPKGVVITHGCLQASLNWMLVEQAPPEGEVLLNQAPFLDVSIMDTYLALVTGGTIFSAWHDVAQPKQPNEGFARSDHGLGLDPRSRSCASCSAASTANSCPGSNGSRSAARRSRTAAAGSLPEGFRLNTYGPTEATVATMRPGSIANAHAPCLAADRLSMPEHASPMWTRPTAAHLRRRGRSSSRGPTSAGLPAPAGLERAGLFDS
jgi:D-alanine--poly(phosphoribitol) ligase subunit 1